MWHRLRSISFALAIGASSAALAEDASFEDRVRAYILNNPEIIIEALAILSEKEAKAKVVAALAQYPEPFTAEPRLGVGDAKARNRVIEFFDYNCVPCKAIHPSLAEFVRNHADFRIEMRHLPILTPGSERAARFALATEEVFGADAYRAAHERLWETRGVLNDAVFERIAKALDLDFVRISSAMEGSAVDARINLNRDVAIALEIMGTPAFVTRESVVFGTTDMNALSEIWLSQ